MAEVFILVVVIVRVRIVPEGWPVFVTVDSLLVSAELVAKTLAGLIHLVSCREVAVATEELSIEVIECLTVLGVVDITGLDSSLKMMLSLLSQWLTFFVVPFFMRVVTVRIGADP